ncbi:MAG: hypothetical protein WC718_18600, partial [Phycisphaerales bacterium]
MSTRIAAMLALGVFAGGALGQAEAPRPADDPALTSPGTEQQMRDLPGRRTPNDLVFPNKPPVQPRPVVGVPAPEGVNFAVPGRRSYPEGTFLAQRRGRIVTTKGGEVVFSPAAPAPGTPGDPPMVLDRCATLEQLQAAIASTPEAGVTLSGQVFVYRGRHYLLPTTFAIDLSSGMDAGKMDAAKTDGMKPDGMKPPAMKPEEGVPEVAAEGTPGDIETQDLIRDLEAQRGVPRTVDPPVAASTDGGAEKLAGVANEGTLLVNRRARLIRVAADEGRFGAAFDNGAGWRRGGAGRCRS